MYSAEFSDEHDDQYGDGEPNSKKNNGFLCAGRSALFFDVPILSYLKSGLPVLATLYPALRFASESS